MLKDISERDIFAAMPTTTRRRDLLRLIFLLSIPGAASNTAYQRACEGKAVVVVSDVDDTLKCPSYTMRVSPADRVPRTLGEVRARAVESGARMARVETFL